MPSDPPAFSPGRSTPGIQRIIRRLVGPLVRLLFRPTIDGLENLPTTGPYMLVANHSGGIALAELGSLMVLWLERLGPDRPLAGFAHPWGLRLFPVAWILKRLGAVPSTYEAARATLGDCIPLLVFPGGDHEALRPIWQAHRVDFGGRRGFLRIAREMGVPIVPMGIRGSHFTMPILWRSRHVLSPLLVVPRLMGLKRWPVTVVGVLGVAAILATEWTWPIKAALTWLWVLSPLQFAVLLPATLRFRVGPALAPEALFADDAADPHLRDALSRVEAAVQALVDR